MSAPSTVAWQPWSAATFARARRDGKPIFVNVAAAWCHWCHVMDERTFARADIARLLSERFVAIRVDADARPDLAERYAEWGWPANAILAPDAQPVLERRGFQEPDAFLGLLQEVVDDNASGRLRRRAAAKAPKPARGDLDRLRDLVLAQLDGYYDERLGGWGRFQKYPFPAPVEHALLEHQHGKSRGVRRALKTLDGTRKLIDPVWGGVFQYSVHDRWDDPHFEKIAAIQAGALDNLAHAFAATGKPRLRDAAVTVRDYVLGFLRDPSGAFWTSQDADATAKDGTVTPGSRYYALGDKARRRAGWPRTDQAVYADWNGLLIAAFVRLHDATGDVAALAAAKAAADAVTATHRTRAGAYTHAARDATGLVHLRDNAAMGRALLALHNATGQERWLELARPVAAFLLHDLQSADGGFFASTQDPAAAGDLAQRRRPLEENGLAMRFLLELAWRLPDEDARPLRAAAERAARALAHRELLKPEGRIVGQFLLGVEWLGLEPTQAVVAGDPDDPQARKLHAAALRHPVAGKLVRWARPDDGYPMERPALYLCKGVACSRPIRDARRVGTAWAALG